MRSKKKQGGKVAIHKNLEETQRKKMRKSTRIKSCSGMTKKYVLCVVRFVSGYSEVFTWVQNHLLVVRNK